MEADAESRVTAMETEYELSNRAFCTITRNLGIPEIDLFASRVNKKCWRFVSWHIDPEAEKVDAFTISWTGLFFYAFPPFTLVSQVIQKIIADKATEILVVPLWPTQPWFPIFNQLLLKETTLFEPKVDLLVSIDRKPHPLHRCLTLVAGLLSGKD